MIIVLNYLSLLNKEILYIMNSYYNVSSSTGKVTGVRGYDYGDDYIVVYFKVGKYQTYTYTYASCGSSHVETMKRLADGQNGLNTYVTTYKPPYASKS
jgi:hypothetical protein